ncbi:thioredoxin family protein [Frankia sp. Cr2]|uniref:thioredoxin family protein n=1 Tax=Frankia sp. Cr2 TaxID=3073932 RepID=UPI002AD53CB0|nr:thioredoxin family protein [Frankia sp. Cr2]
MRLTILHVPECPNATTLGDRLRPLIRAGDVVTIRVVDSEDLAAQVGMTGSPTLLVDGVDPFAEPGSSANLSCRLYRDETGHLAGAPSVAQLRRALGLPAGSVETPVVDGEDTGA